MAKKSNVSGEAPPETTGSIDKKPRLVLVFEGKYAPLYQAIVEKALADDRDEDTVVFRLLASALSIPADTAAA